MLEGGVRRLFAPERNKPDTARGVSPLSREAGPTEYRFAAARDGIDALPGMGGPIPAGSSGFSQAGCRASLSHRVHDLLRQEGHATIAHGEPA